MKELRSRFSGESTGISAASTIILGGNAHEKVVENLQLDGTLKADGPVSYF